MKVDYQQGNQVLVMTTESPHDHYRLGRISAALNLRTYPIQDGKRCLSVEVAVIIDKLAEAK